MIARRSLAAALLLGGTSACSDAAPTGAETPGPPNITIVSGDRQSGAVGATLAEPLVVSLLDSRGRPIAGAQVLFFDTQPLVRDSAVTNQSGIAQVRWTPAGKASVQEIVASATITAGGRSVSVQTKFSITTLPGLPALLRVVRAVPMGLPGATLDTLHAAVTDQFDNPIAAVPVEWVVRAGGGSVVGLASNTDADGIARAIWTIGPSKGTNALDVSSSGLATSVSVLATTGFPAMSVVTGGSHTCALAPGGIAYCWGSNAKGQLGFRFMFASGVPGRVAGELTFKSLTAGALHTCGLTTNDEAYCWGGGQYGQAGSFEDATMEPRRVAPELRFTSLTAGNYHTCGLTTDGSVWCWGNDTFGQLGTGRDRSTNIEWFGSVSTALPSRLLAGVSFTEIVASADATCGVATIERVFCWGNNSKRALGAASGTCRMTAYADYPYLNYDEPCSTRPIPIALNEPLRSLTTASGSFCGLALGRGLVCWGDVILSPWRFSEARVTAAWSLGSTVCGLDDGDAVACWSMRTFGGPVAPPFDRAIPLVNLRSVGERSCGLSRDTPPIVYCWGTNTDGELGDGTRLFRASPVAVALPRT